MKIFPPTMQRVAKYTCDNINSKIKSATIANLKEYKNYDQEQFAKRIKELDTEWDMERIVETGAASIVLLSSIIGYNDRRSSWYLLSGAAGIFLLQHALQGWCPSLPILRRLGIRSAEEINDEKTAIKAIRGDFSKETDDVEELFNMIEED